MRFLLEAKANPNIKNNQGITPHELSVALKKDATVYDFITEHQSKSKNKDTTTHHREILKDMKSTTTSTMETKKPGM